MKIKITWVERDTNNAACLGLDEIVECEDVAQAVIDAIYHAECEGVDLARFECIAEVV